jgi:hypothetical protein
MPIIAPAKRINPTIRRRTGFEPKGVYATLFLTSMVDMFAIMVIFLLQSFSAEGELIILPQGLELPKAKNTGVLERAPSLVVAKEKIMFEGLAIIDTAKVIEAKEWHVPELQEALKGYKEKIAAEIAKSNPPLTEEEAKKKAQRINISADRRLLFNVIKKVIYNAGFAGFPDFRFAVFAGGTGPEEPPK